MVIKHYNPRRRRYGELTVHKADDGYWEITFNGETKYYPASGMNQWLWKLIWGDFRSHM